MSASATSSQGAGPAAAAQRRSLRQRAMVRRLGPRPTPNSARPIRVVTASSAAPAANNASARRRTAGHAYDPGLGRSGGPATAARCASNALFLAAVKHPCACHNRISVATRSRPPLRRVNSAAPCPPHSHTATPYRGEN